MDRFERVPDPDVRGPLKIGGVYNSKPIERCLHRRVAFARGGFQACPVKNGHAGVRIVD